MLTELHKQCVDERRGTVVDMHIVPPSSVLCMLLSDWSKKFKHKVKNLKGTAEH